MAPTLIEETPLLPLELWDSTITHLRDDMRTLSECSLVCRSWLPMARRHRFHTVTVLGPQRRSRLLLCDPSSTVLPHVRKLHLKDGVVPRADFQPWDDRAPTQAARFAKDVAWIDDLLPQIRVNELTALRALFLFNVRWDGLSANSRSSLIHLCRGLTLLRHVMEELNHDARCQIAVELIGASPSLQHFTLWCLADVNETPAKPLNIAPYSRMPTKAAPHLHTLDISADVGPVLTVLHMVFPVLHLQELYLGPLYEGTVSLVLSFLHSCAATLVRLSLSFATLNETTYEPAFCAGGGVSCLTALRTFSIKSHPNSKHIPDILRQITSGNLEHLDITLLLRTSAPSDFDDLADVLTTGPLAVSRPHVTIICWGKLPEFDGLPLEHMRDTLLAGLQSLHKEGRLQLKRFIVERTDSGAVVRTEDF